MPEAQNRKAPRRIFITLEDREFEFGEVVYRVTDPEPNYYVILPDGRKLTGMLRFLNAAVRPFKGLWQEITEVLEDWDHNRTGEKLNAQEKQAQDEAPPDA
jgi:hypothetical protein